MNRRPRKPQERNESILECNKTAIFEVVCMPNIMFAFCLTKIRTSFNFPQIELIISSRCRNYNQRNFVAPESSFHSSGSQPFWARVTLIWLNKFSCTFKSKIRPQSSPQWWKSAFLTCFLGYLKIWWHTYKNSAVHFCAAANRMRNTALNRYSIAVY